jgi:hypothetical protein
MSAEIPGAMSVATGHWRRSWHDHRCHAERVDLSATSDSGISMSHRRVFGRRMWVELPALLPWFCGGAVRAQGGRGWPLFKPPATGMMFRARCARPYRG